MDADDRPDSRPSDDVRAVDIAARASNYSERERVVQALRAAVERDTASGRGSGRERGTEPGTGPEQLDAFDAWHVDRLAGRLAERFHKELLHGGAPTAPGTAGPSRQELHREIADVLSTYRRWELAPGALGADAEGDARRTLEDLHRDWLPSYRSALDRLEASRATGRERGWRDADTYYGRAAIACEPFLEQLDRQVGAALEADRAGRRATGQPPLFDERLVEDVQLHLLNRFEIPLAWAVEANANVHCSVNGIDKATATTEDYLAYLRSTFRDRASYHAFYLEFPVLARWLAHVTRLLAEHAAALVRRLARDAADIGDALFGRPIARVVRWRLGRSDFHSGARSVATVDVVLADGSEGTFVYKPRCVRAEAATQRLLERLRHDGVLDFATRQVLPREGYGYEALIPAGRNRVATRSEAESIYAELGGYLALFHVLGGGDLHFENVLVADGHAFVCDCETVLGVQLPGQDLPVGTVLDSVFKTGLLEWPRTAPATSTAEMRISGYAGGETYELPVPVPRIGGPRLSFETSVVHEAEIRVDPGAPNRVFLGDRIVQPDEFSDAILDGFTRVHEWFERRPEQAASCVRDLFADASVRFISWGTQVYSQLLIAALHPRCLMEPLEADLLVNTMRTYPRKWDGDRVLAERELASMWRLDIPIFTVAAHGRQLVHDHGDPLATTLELSPVDHAAERIRRLSADNRARQAQYIAASLSAGELDNPAFTASAVEYAARIGTRLCAMLRPAGEPAPWTSFQVTGQGVDEVDIEGDLYAGSAGVALFLAYLDAVEPRPEFRRAAERALRHALDTRDRNRIGAFQGLGGLVYLLTHLYHLWRDPRLLEQAARLGRELEAELPHDRHFDVLGGAAGVIPVMLGLARTAAAAAVPGGPGIAVAAERLAHHCGDHLLRHAEDDGPTLSWPHVQPEEVLANLTGFAHGAGGIGWALIRLGCRADRLDCIDAGRRAIAYEARHFDDREQDWYDLRTNVAATSPTGRHFANAWCNGAAGIGLGRIDSWSLLGKDEDTLLKEAHLALAATLRNFHLLGNDTLCHGRSGNAEFLLRFARLKDEPAFQLEANVQVQAQWRELDESLSGIANRTAGFFPGLMLGLAGFGLHYLRLARPDRVPSPLLLDPPPLDQPSLTRRPAG